VKKFLIPLLLCITFISIEAQQNNFWDRVNVGVLGGPLFPGGDEADALSTGYFIGIDARYQLFRFMAVGFSVGRNAWGGEVDYSLFKSTQYYKEPTEISSGKTNV